MRGRRRRRRGGKARRLFRRRPLTPASLRSACFGRRPKPSPRKRGEATARPSRIPCAPYPLSLRSAARGARVRRGARFASPRLRGEGCRRQQACAAGEGEGRRRRRRGGLVKAPLPAPPPHPRFASLRLFRPQAKTLSPQAGRGDSAPFSYSLRALPVELAQRRKRRSRSSVRRGAHFASPRLRGEGCRRQQACAAGEGEGAATKRARRARAERLVCTAPSPPLRFAPLVSAEGRNPLPASGERRMALRGPTR